MNVDFMTLFRGLQSSITGVSERVASWRWGAVSSVDPLMVLQDGDELGHEVYPDSLVGGLVVGDRVRCVTVNRRTLVIGRSSPRAAVESTSRTLVVTGSVDVTSPSTSLQGTGAVSYGVTFADNPKVFITPDINPSGVITVGTATSSGDDLNAFTVRYRTVSGSANDRQLKWVAIGPVA